MLGAVRVGATLPAQDIERAKSFYADKLGLKPIEEREEEAFYQVGDANFGVFKSHGKPSGDHTQLFIEVEDLRATTADLRKNGIVFEQYDLPGLKTDEDGIVDIEGEPGAFFKDSEGNLIAIGEFRPGRS